MFFLNFNIFLDQNTPEGPPVILSPLPLSGAPATALLRPPALRLPGHRPPATALPLPARRPLPAPPGRLLRSAAASNSPAAAAQKKRAATGLTKPRLVSPALQAVVGAAEIPRTEALKRLWAYIKQHNLQDPADKKVIVCDEKLKVLFAGQERVGFLEVAKLLNPHFVK